MYRILTVEEMLAANAEWYIPSAWKDETDPRSGEPLSVRGADLIMARVREMQVRNLELRQQNLARAATDPAFQQEELERCAGDVLYWLTHYAWIFNANERQFVPFLPFEAQVRKILHPLYLDLVTPLKDRSDRRDHAVLKSRYMGATFSGLLVIGWGGRFHAAWDGGVPFIASIGANKLENLDKRGDPDTHFGKLWTILTTVHDGAPWMLRDLANKRKCRAYLQIRLESTDATLSGEAVNENFGRSGRSTVAMLDEEAFAEGARLANMGLSDNTNVIWRFSTPNGRDRSFAATYLDPKIQIDRVKLHWTDCPWYDQKWYEAQCRTRTAQAIAQELDCSFEASAENRYWALFSRAHNVRDTVPVIPAAAVYWCIDPGHADGCAVSLWQTDWEGGTHNIHSYIYRPDAYLDYMVPFLLGRFPDVDAFGHPAQDWGWGPAERAEVQQIGRMMKTAGGVIYLGASDLSQTRINSASVQEDLLRKWNIGVLLRKCQNKWDDIHRVQRGLAYVRVPRRLVGQRLAGSAHDVVDVFENYRARERRDPDTPDAALKPLHNEFSNGADTFQLYFAHVGLIAPLLTRDEKDRGAAWLNAPKRGIQANPKLMRNVYGD